MKLAPVDSVSMFDDLIKHHLLSFVVFRGENHLVKKKKKKFHRSWEIQVLVQTHPEDSRFKSAKRISYFIRSVALDISEITPKCYISEHFCNNVRRGLYIVGLDFNNFCSSLSEPEPGLSKLMLSQKSCWLKFINLNPVC